MKPTPTRMTLRAKCRLIRCRLTRRRRLARALRSHLMDRRLPVNRWDMSEAEDREYHRLHDFYFRNFQRLARVASRWGYSLH